MFFPTIVQDQEQELEICKTVRFLDIMHKIPDKKKVADKSLFSKGMGAIILSMFPNAGNSSCVNFFRDERHVINY